MSFTVLVPHDFSEAADAALAWAVDLVRAAGGTIRLVHVIPLVVQAISPVPALAPYPQPEDIESTRAQLREVAARAKISATIDVVVAPNQGAAILTDAEQAGTTLIVMGTHGRGGLSRMVLGSVSDYVVRHAPCPVVTTRGTRAK